MKKLLVFAAMFALSGAVYAQDKVDAADVVDETPAIEAEMPRRQLAAWPAFFAVSELPATPDLIGLRLTIPFSTKQESVTGFDFGLWARTQFFEGIALNILRNDVKDQLTGFQFGVYNSAAQADALGIQFGLWNEAGTLCGAQFGLVNAVGAMQGFQIGLINRSEELYGFQLGVINVIRDAEMRFLPIVNVGF